MHSFSCTLFAVHIPDGVLTLPWLAGGFALAAVLGGGAFLIDAVRNRLRGDELREEEIAQLALLTAAFFVASQIHLRVGPTSVHLLLNGLLGVVLRWRAALAIPVGLLLQAALFGHGGFTSLGVNSCVMVLPALAAWGLFALLHRLPWRTQPWFRGLLVCVCVMLCVLGMVYSVALIVSNNWAELTYLDTAWADHVTGHPVTLGVALGAGLVGAWVERRLENAPEFPLGLFVGIVAVQLTVLLNALVLVYGGEEDWRSLAVIVFAAHIPISVAEGIVLGGVVGFLARVKPELLRWQR
jgi:ABC-type Co2+ transport system permease subunit